MFLGSASFFACFGVRPLENHTAGQPRAQARATQFLKARPGLWRFLHKYFEKSRFLGESFSRFLYLYT